MNYGLLFSIGGTILNLGLMIALYGNGTQEWMGWFAATMWSVNCIIHEIRHQKNKE